MTKEEINKHCEEICEWLKSKQPSMPRTYLGEVTFKRGDSYLDESFSISINNYTGLECKFYDGKRHATRVGPWEIDECSLEYKVDLLKKWASVKTDILSLIKDASDEADANAAAKEAKEKALCDSVTEFTL
jgi:hypothetical protein